MHARIWLRTDCWKNSKPGVYKVIIQKSVVKVLRRLPKDLVKRISKAIDDLAQELRPTGFKKLEGYPNLYRIRVGEWLISYAIEDDQLIVLVIEVAPSSGAYRNL
jgi:mRNA interferase RelE/StbE